MTISKKHPNLLMSFASITGLSDNASKQTHPLTNLIAKLLCSNEEYRRERENELNNILDTTFRDAFITGSKGSLQAIHLSFDELLRLSFNRHDNNAERSVVLFSAQQRMLDQIFSNDKNSIDLQRIPSTAADFEEWFNRKCWEYQDSPHLLFDYLEKEGGLEAFKHVIQQEAGVHVAFDDVLASTMIGSKGNAKAEIFHNLEDEMGGGDPDKFHMTVFGRLVNHLGLETIQKSDLSAEALACGNTMMYLSKYRQFYPESVGYLGFVEAITSPRFAKITNAGRRLGFPSEVLEFHAEHSELDEEHTEGWLNRVIKPTIDEDPSMAKRIGLGVLLREKISLRYWDRMLEGALLADGKVPEQYLNPSLGGV